ncbi:kinase-like domain-containing protein [Rhizophagus clarus]|uniref:Kinase-like domain-containing protein n=1 Tax=Rhizophagus clarus TaxID=94130 RepID=A0A8H3M4C1_9GLOM|nr:kinase-like domain-containing protein [Rhizophagus clarus]
MEILNKPYKERPKDIWKYVDEDKHQKHVMVSINSAKTEEIDDRIVYMEDLEKRKEVYAIWPERYIEYWDIENQKWKKITKFKVALKSLDNSSDIRTDFLNEVKSYLQIHLYNVIKCHGITQDPNTKGYMMVLKYCEGGNLRNYYLNNNDYDLTVLQLLRIATGLLDIHNADKVHKDFHSGNILHDIGIYISDLGMCQPVNNEEEKSGKREGVYGILPYMAPEILRGYQYTKAADIYSFGIVMNEFLSEEIPFNDIPHDYTLAIEICKGLRPRISEDVPKLFADLIMKCWDAKLENRPTVKELYQVITKLHKEQWKTGGEFDSQMYKYKKIRNKVKNGSNKNKSENIKTHPQAIYTSRLLNFKNLPEPVNSSGLSSFKVNSDAVPSVSTNLISECLDCLVNIDLAINPRPMKLAKIK